MFWLEISDMPPRFTWPFMVLGFYCLFFTSLMYDVHQPAFFRASLSLGGKILLSKSLSLKSSMGECIQSYLWSWSVNILPYINKSSKISNMKWFLALTALSASASALTCDDSVKPKACISNTFHNVCSCRSQDLTDA